MEILKTVLMIIFAIDLSRYLRSYYYRKVNQQGLERSAVWQILTGDRTRDVLWKVRL